MMTLAETCSSVRVRAKLTLNSLYSEEWRPLKDPLDLKKLMLGVASGSFYAAYGEPQVVIRLPKYIHLK